MWDFLFFFLVAFLISSLFVVMQKKLSIVENTFVFLIILVISINFNWIIAEELKFIKMTNEAVNYAAFILNRSIIIPMILVVQLNLIIDSNSKAKSFFISIASISILLLLFQLSIFFDIAKYKNWNISFDLIYIVILHLIAFYFHKFYQGLDREVKYS